MNHQQYKEWLNLLVYDELEDQRRPEMQKHLEECNACREEFAQRKKLFNLMEQRPSAEPSDELLQQARTDLRAALRTERNKRTFSERLQDRLIGWMPVLKPAMGYAATLAAGLLVGALVFPRTTVVETQPLAPASKNEVFGSAPGNTQISNIRFLDADSSGDGQIEFAFDAVKPMRVKGNVNDPKVQEILTYAVMKEENPGVRLRAVSTLSANHTKPDAKVKAALLSAMQTDKNDGVRRAALATLQKYPFDDEIQGAMLCVLQNDPNPALRIEAIKSLEGKKAEGQELISVLKDRMESDDNSFIRQRAKAVLEEVEQ